jgi:Carboxypeptidase regulatory-like domain
MILSKYLILGRDRCVRVICAGAVSALAVVAVGAMTADLMIQAPMAAAQNIGQRVVSGTVVNDAEAIQSGATVFLKDLKTKLIRSYTTEADGAFRFTQVNMAEDHEVWAELNGKKSAVKTVSSWDARKKFVVELKLK